MSNKQQAISGTAVNQLVLEPDSFRLDAAQGSDKARNGKAQHFSELVSARRPRKAQRAVLQRTVKRALQLATQQSRLRTADLCALLTNRQFRQKRAKV